MPVAVEGNAKGAALLQRRVLNLSFCVIVSVISEELVLHSRKLKDSSFKGISVFVIGFNFVQLRKECKFNQNRMYFLYCIDRFQVLNFRLFFQGKRLFLCYI